jgi:diphthamide biosynthesis protein 2
MIHCLCPLNNSCCVDEIAAAHINADLIVHYGISCLSKPSRISTWFVFEKKDLDIRDCIEKLGSVFRENQVIRVLHDVPYDHRINEFMLKLRKQFPHVSYRYIPRWYLRDHQGSEMTSTPTFEMPHDTIFTLNFASTEFDNEIPMENRLSPSSYKKEDVLLYIGGESRLLTNLLMLPPSIVTKIHAYNPETKQFHTSNDLSTRWMMRR